VRPDVVLSELEAYAPDIMAAVAASTASVRFEHNGSTLLGVSFRAARRISFDHAVLERTGRAAVIRPGYAWSALGTCGAIWDVADKDDDQNVTQVHVTLHDSSGNYVASDGTHIGLVGVDDLVVVASDNTVLVAPRTHSDAVKALVAAVNDSPAGPAVLDRSRYFRPWG